MAPDRRRTRGKRRRSALLQRGAAPTTMQRRGTRPASRNTCRTGPARNARSLFRGPERSECDRAPRYPGARPRRPRRDGGSPSSSRASPPPWSLPMRGTRYTRRTRRPVADVKGGCPEFHGGSDRTARLAVPGGGMRRRSSDVHSLAHARSTTKHYSPMLLRARR